ncbi:MAG: hypothetical protein QGI45_16595, partial [Myxococcota bacterium]|nr:hypothetical protein [Myxococcota bacterium]
MRMKTTIILGLLIGTTSACGIELQRGGPINRAFHASQETSNTPENQIQDIDCLNIVGGTSTLDQCGVCDDNPENDCQQDCAGVWGGSAVADGCGTCDHDPFNDCQQDCAGVFGGDATLDACGVCNGNGIPEGACDCAGNVLDACGVCGGTGTDLDEDNICDADDACVGAYDACGQCNGPGAIYACGCTDLLPNACDCEGNVLDACGVCAGNGTDDDEDGICDAQ